MGKKKALWIILLTAVLCVGCAEGDLESYEDSASQQGFTEAESLAENDSPGLTKEGGEILPQVVIEEQKQYHEAKDQTLLMESYVDKVTLQGNGYDAAALTLESLFDCKQSSLQQLAETVQQDYAYRKSNGEAYFFPYYYSSFCRTARLDSYIFSMSGEDYTYSGGAGGKEEKWGVTIDLATGEELELLSLAPDAYAFVECCKDGVIKQLAGREADLLLDYENYVRENLEGCSWYLDASGIRFIFQPATVLSYEAGEITVLIPYEQVSDYMKPEYCGLHGSWIAAVGTDGKVDFTSGQTRRTLLFETQKQQDYGQRIVLKVDDEVLPLEPSVRLEQAYLMRNEEKQVFLVYTVDWSSDDYETFVFNLSDNNFTQTANVWARLEGRNLNLNSLELNFTLQVLGTYGADMPYVLHEDGTMEALKDIYEIHSYAESSGLTTIKELPVVMEGEETVLPTGSRIYVTATDNDGTVWFQTGNSKGSLKTGEIHYVRDAETYELTIDGVSEYEYFEDLPYVG